VNTIEYKGLLIECQYKPKNRHTYIELKKSSQSTQRVILKTPLKSHAKIVEILEMKESWIRSKLKTFKNHPVLETTKSDKYLLFGEYHKGYFEKFSSMRDLENFYKESAINYLTPLVEFYALKMKLQYSALVFREMKSRWGSCSSHKKITLNSELIKLKKELINYVVVHELAHLVHMNHSKEFHSLVNSYLPNSKELRDELKKISLS
jgi:predicted metal-dependent hydrolase